MNVKGEEDKGEHMERLAVQLTGLADVYVNDAFGSWQPHTSTYQVTKYLPSFAGLCMQVTSQRLTNVSSNAHCLKFPSHSHIIAMPVSINVT